ncbi:hypothetical protein Nepgr_031060 [Nepenthes gracilis]|uniref:Uncharacterized protein n=1 Tax=Nepenthes gracilis TaxID=150966 RepID=A0AAD3Y4G3_NEPGR|nr:hypothetical protein Nepgr_031060 [Nepenthes gracilis]
MSGLWFCPALNDQTWEQMAKWRVTPALMLEFQREGRSAEEGGDLNRREAVRERGGCSLRFQEKVLGSKICSHAQIQSAPMDTAFNFLRLGIGQLWQHKIKDGDVLQHPHLDLHFEGDSSCYVPKSTAMHSVAYPSLLTTSCLPTAAPITNLDASGGLGSDVTPCIGEPLCTKCL